MQQSLKQISNPPNPYSRYSLEWLDVPPSPRLQVYEENVTQILNKNTSPDIPFEYSINPYRGCFHGCAYCYARPTHQYLDFGAGSDFDRKIVVKVNAAERLLEQFNKPSWKGSSITFSGVTDCYQPLEACYQITRSCLEICADFRNPVAIITKGALIRRDIDLLSRLNQYGAVQVYFSITFSDDSMSKKIEPFAPRPSVRFRAMRELSEAGIPVAVGVAPIIPGLNDHQIFSILEMAKEAGAKSAFMTLLRLPAGSREVFLERIKEAVPQFFDKIVSQTKELKGGKLNRSEFGKRFRGEGERWKAIDWLFKSSCQRLGLNKDRMPQNAAASPFERPLRQLQLWSPVSKITN